MEMFVNKIRLDVGQLFTQSARRGHPCTLDTFLVIMANVLNSRRELDLRLETDLYSKTSVYVNVILKDIR